MHLKPINNVRLHLLPVNLDNLKRMPLDGDIVVAQAARVEEAQAIAFVGLYGDVGEGEGWAAGVAATTVYERRWGESKKGLLRI